LPDVQETNKAYIVRNYIRKTRVIFIKTIPLTKGYEAMVDDEDYEMLVGYKWYSSVHRFPNGKVYVYAKHMNPTMNGKRTEERMHQLIMDIPQGMHVDHIDGNTLNNQKSNLRIVTNRQNCMNRHQKKASKYPGVTWAKRELRWIAQAQINGKHIHIGSFRSEEDARQAYLGRVTPIENKKTELNFAYRLLQCPSQEKVLGVELK
jgi:hypothetical protein